jgi:peptidoglycan hydrolase-like protein with peptidoglycan-binding domain
MGLQSQLLKGDPKLEACLIDDSAHITLGARGDHVKEIQIALNELSNVFLIIDGIYGPKTAAAVQAYKDAPQRQIRQPGQQTADNIVGKRTIKSLDDEMDILENETGDDSLVSTTAAGDPQHDHSQCPTQPFVTAPGPDGRPLHHATPINPQGFGRKINIGGEGEAVGFEDMITKTVDGKIFGPLRPFTENIPDRCASDICSRSAPLNGEIRKEISRIALPGCRLTYANDPPKIERNRAYLLSLGTVIEDVSIFSKSGNVEQTLQVLVIAMRGDGRFVNIGEPSDAVFPPPIRF